MNREEAEHIVDEYTNAIKNSMRFTSWQASTKKKRDAEMLRECLIGHLVIRPTESKPKPIEIHEPLCFDEALSKAYGMGKAAYLDGLPCEPSLDDGVQNMCLYLSIEQSGQMMKKWRDGWCQEQMQYLIQMGL